MDSTFEQIDIVDVILASLLLLLTDFTTASSVSIVDFEQLNVRWAILSYGKHSKLAKNTPEICQLQFVKSVLL